MFFLDNTIKQRVEPLAGLSAESGPYLYDSLDMFTQERQALCCPDTSHHPRQTLKDRCSSPEGQALTLHLIEFIILHHHFKRILQRKEGSNR